MAKKQEKGVVKKEAKPKEKIKVKAQSQSRIKDETRHGIWAIVFFLLCIFSILSAFGGAGPAGKVFHTLFGALFGYGYFLLPIMLGLLGASFTMPTRPSVGMVHTLSSLLFLLSGLGIVDIVSNTNGGGIFGKIISFPFVKLFGIYTAIILLGGVLIISMVLLFDKKPELGPILKKVWQWILSLFKKKEDEDYEEDEVEEEEYEPEEEVTPEKEPEEIEKGEKKETAPKIVNGVEEDFVVDKKKQKKFGNYVPPPLSLLEEDKGKPNVGDIKANSNIIKRALLNFGIEVEMDEITIGPTVTRYALKPAEGVKLSRIVGLQNDLGLALAAHPLRIEAPIPGKSLVGIEVPNKTKSTVGLATLLADEKFQGGSLPLLMGLGKAINGKSFFGNMAKMPHLLIAGSTGSGKSVTIHALITSLLYRNGPDDLRFIMIDPKRVELTLYNGIPQLLTPVITDPKKAILALKWAAKEMDRRYDILETEGVRDITSYRANVMGASKKEDGTEAEAMPFIVVIIDELADIMQSYPRELESAIVRLAQMSRAVGIDLILSTQRPSVNVITGLIKANIPARIALQVASQIDSRTILDQGGAEKLLGAGDMLYLSGEMSQPERLQSAYISENEVKKVVKYLKDAYKDEVVEELNLSGTNISADKSIFDSAIDDGDEDEMYEEARMAVIEAGKASTSYLQRKLKLGYARAARLIDMLEERGVVGPGDGAKPREVLEKGVEAEREGFM